ncbi:MAG: M15 family metallopeptidase [Deltaproteobacteria bacterium]
MVVLVDNAANPPVSYLVRPADDGNGTSGRYRPQDIGQFNGSPQSHLIGTASDQPVALQPCRMPGEFESLVAHADISPTSSQARAVMVAPSRDAAWAAAASVDLQINSAFRTLAEQFVLYNRSACYTPARPGTSPHESGRALDLNNWAAAGVIAAMQSAGCTHSYPSSDPVHFDCPGTDLSVESVLTFQRLWNVNNPGDLIAEDGSYGPQTESRLAMSPAAGFASAGDCGHCTAHCEGAVIVAADCGRGDCAAYGATCVDDAQGVRCVSAFCPATGERDTCLPDGRIAHCMNGAIQSPMACPAGQSCGVSGATASCAAAMADAGGVDGGDAGTTDARVTDASTDASGDALDGREDFGLHGGCACRTTRRGGARDRGMFVWGLLAAIAVIARRRRGARRDENTVRPS